MRELKTNRKIIVVKTMGYHNLSLVINIGSEHGVKEGDKFIVYHEDSEDIKDPITGESLGCLETVRGTGVADHVQPKMTTIISNRKERPRKIVSKPNFGISSIIKTETVEYSEPELIPFDEPQVGDKVKKI